MLTHGDYQHFNVLWSRGRLSALVDWSQAGIASPDLDVGHCRLNLAVLYSPEIAERFRRVYESEAGRQVEPWWDIHQLLAYGDDWQTFIPVQVAGRAPVDVRGMTGRVEKLLVMALARCDLIGPGRETTPVGVTRVVCVLARAPLALLASDFEQVGGPLGTATIERRRTAVPAAGARDGLRLVLVLVDHVLERLDGRR